MPGRNFGRFCAVLVPISRWRSALIEQHKCLFLGFLVFESAAEGRRHDRRTRNYEHSFEHERLELIIGASGTFTALCCKPQVDRAFGNVEEMPSAEEALGLCCCVAEVVRRDRIKDGLQGIRFVLPGPAREFVAAVGALIELLYLVAVAALAFLDGEL